MTKKCAVATRDHCAGVPQQRFDGMARGRFLPVVTIERAGSEDDLRDLLLGGAIAMPVEGLQHSAQARALLCRQSRVWWN